MGLSQSSQGATDALNDDRFPGMALLMSEWLQSRLTIVCGVWRKGKCRKLDSRMLIWLSRWSQWRAPLFTRHR